jgi:hypothetical protein
MSPEEKRTYENCVNETDGAPCKVFKLVPYNRQKAKKQAGGSDETMRITPSSTRLFLYPTYLITRLSNWILFIRKLQSYSIATKRMLQYQSAISTLATVRLSQHRHKPAPWFGSIRFTTMLKLRLKFCNVC